MLPPQLLQVILNKDTPVSVSILEDICDNDSLIHYLSVRADLVARTKSCDVESSVRIVHQGRGDGPVGHSSVQEEICDDIAVQTDWHVQGLRGAFRDVIIRYLYFTLLSYYTLSRLEWDFNCIAGMFIEEPFR